MEDKLTINQLKHNHSGGDSVRIKYSDLSGTPTGATIFSGSVALNGTALNLPTGWTSAHNSDGYYTITHNLGYATYNLVITINDDFNLPKIFTKAAATFEVKIVNPTAAAFIDSAFDFVLVKQ